MATGINEALQRCCALLRIANHSDPRPATEASYSSPPIAPALMTSGSLHPSADVFVPPPPVDPRDPTEQEMHPDPFREAEMINGTTQTKTGNICTVTDTLSISFMQVSDF